MSIQPRPARRLNGHNPVAKQAAPALDKPKKIPDSTPKSMRKPAIANLLKSKFIDALAILVLLGGFVGLYITFQSNQDVKRQIETVSANDGSDDSNDSSSSSSASRPPSIDRPLDRDVRDYHVDPDKPRFLSINSINVFARITHVGRDADGNVGSPTNIHDTSWYTSSSVPDSQLDRGSTVITGHVGRDRYNGVFYDLPLVDISDVIHVTLGDGSVVEYKVTGTKTVPVEEMRMGDYLGYAGSDIPQLHLITCVGVYDSELLSFRDRLIITAEQT